MESKKFSFVAATEANPRWNNLISYEEELYHRKEDIRSYFTRDYCRILHSNAYRRLKHKTQVFFATENDHICTRIEHVNHVASVSYTISKFLGLNTELSTAIAIGHDLGHAPFGHQGETILKRIVKEHIKGENTFWHEKNSLHFVDKLETLQDTEGKDRNLNLTYAVRDGLVCHCGEVDENAIRPREDYISLGSIKTVSQYPPYTWEGCIVKIADKISYLGRDIEDALTLKLLRPSQIKELKRIITDTAAVEDASSIDIREINNTVLIHGFIIDLCENSTPTDGIKFSKKYLDLINKVKEFNYHNIYLHPRLNIFKEYATIVINSIFNTLKDRYKGTNTLEELRNYGIFYPILIENFSQWLIKYSNINLAKKKQMKYENKVVYDIEDTNQYYWAIVDYISGMTDNFALKIFKELTSF